MHASRAIFLGRVSMPPAGSVWPTVSTDTVDELLPLSVSDMRLTPMPWLWLRNSSACHEPMTRPLSTVRRANPGD